MPENLMTALPSIVITLCVIVGGLFVFRRSYAKSLGELQERVIGIYKLENEAQAKEIKNLKRDNVAMRAAFKQLGVEIEIDGDTITIINGVQPKRKRIIQVPSIEEEDT
jgi:hypothetical protein